MAPNIEVNLPLQKSGVDAHYLTLPLDEKISQSVVASEHLKTKSLSRYNEQDWLLNVQQRQSLPSVPVSETEKIVYGSDQRTY